MRLSKDEYELLYKLQKCTSKRNNRPVLNGVHMSLTNDGVFKAYCTDTHLLGTVRFEKEPDNFDVLVKVPKLTAKYESVQIVPNYDKVSFCAIDERGQVVQEVIENTIEGNFPDVERVIKDAENGSQHLRVSLNAAMLKKALEVCGGGTIDIFVNGDELVMIQGVGDVSGHSRAYLCQVNHS